MTISRGWAQAHARPWNDQGTDAAIRLDRGSAPFLRAASEYLSDRVEGKVFSPALVASGARVWKKAGYEVYTRLDVMERVLTGLVDEGPVPTVAVAHPDLVALADIDRRCFDGFWSIGRSGIEEAMVAASTSQVLVTTDGPSPVGYAVVGAQLGAAFLQRIAVVPETQGSGHGLSLVLAALNWAWRRGARTVVLNVRPGNERAQDLYRRNGFIASAYQLQVLGFES